MNASIKCAAVVAAATVAAGVAITPAAAKTTPAAKLAGKAVGTWAMTVDPRPVRLPTGTIDPPAFPSVVSLNHGGTLTDSVSSLAQAASALLGADDYTNGLGSWKIKNKTLRFSFQRYFTKAGQYVGRQEVRGKGSVSAKGTKQVATVTFYDAGGTQVGPAIVVDVSGRRLMP